MLEIKKRLNEMTFEEKSAILTGGAALTSGSVARLGIPSLNMSDGPHGIRRLIGHPKQPQECHIPGGDTALPTASAVGASWSEEVAYTAGQVIARDCRQEDIQMLLAPGTNMKRTPHCGRNFEYYSEDPYHSGMLAAAFINGVQSKGVGTSLKHFAVNSQEINRGTINAEVDERTLREYYLKPFQVTLQHSDPTSVMCAYNKLGGIWCSEHHWLLTEILKDTWGYDGMVVSDWCAVHNISRALKAGLDLQMPKNPNIEKQLRWGLEHNIITMADIDRAVEKVLEWIDRVQTMYAAHGEEYHNYDRQAQHERAYEAACECITLLRNERNILPLSPKKYQKVAIVGRCAEEPVIMGGGSSKVTVEASSVEAIWPNLQKHAEGMELTYISLEDILRSEQGMYKMTEIGNSYDAVVYFVGDAYGPDAETESFDRDNLYFPNYINAVINAGMEANPNFILVLQTGGAVLPRRWEKVPALVQMWYAGEAGGRAIADVLFGKVNPSGKLSETFPLTDRTDLDYPGDGVKLRYLEKYEAGYRYYDKHPEQVWFPFGHGLSYTEFTYRNLALSQTFMESPEFTLDVAFELTNSGQLDGKEVVQLYIAPLDSIVDRPVKELKKFAKVALAAGETKTVRFTLDSSDFAYFNPFLHDWHVETGRYQILVSASSVKAELIGTVEIRYLEDYTIDTVDASMVL